MKLKYQFVVREVGGSVMAVAIGEDSRKFNGLVKLNSVGATIFNALKTDVTEDQLVAAILDEYDVGADEAKLAVGNFLSKLRDDGLITD